MMNKILLFFLLSVGVIQLFQRQSMAQSKGYLVAQTGLQSFVNRDPSFSPLKYAGNRTFSSLMFALEKENKTEHYLFNFGYGPVLNRYGNPMTALTTGFLNHTYYHQNDRSTKGFQGGWTNQNEINIRQHNGFSNYRLRFDYFTAFGPTGRYLLPFKWKNQAFVWESNIFFQALGFKVQSDFIEINPRGFNGSEENLVSRTFSSLDWFLLGRDYSMGYWTGLNWELPSGNSLGFQYRYDYTRVKGFEDINRAGGAYMFLLKVKLW